MSTSYENKNFSDTGNFGFGIQGPSDLGIKDDPSAGIAGLDFSVVPGGPGSCLSDKKLGAGCTGRRPRAGSNRTVEGPSFRAKKVLCLPQRPIKYFQRKKLKRSNKSK